MLQQNLPNHIKELIKNEYWQAEFAEVNLRDLKRYLHKRGYKRVHWIEDLVLIKMATLIRTQRLFGRPEHIIISEASSAGMAIDLVQEVLMWLNSGEPQPDREGDLLG